MIATALATIAFMAAANWFAGGQMQIRKRLGLPGRSIYYAGLAAIFVGYAAYGPLGALAGASFTAWRLPGWYGALDAGMSPLATEGQGRIFGIDVRPLRLRDFIVMASRGLLCFPVFVFMAVREQAWLPIIVLVNASLLIACVYDLANHVPKTRRVDLAEAGTGAVWGLALFAVLEGAF